MKSTIHFTIINCIWTKTLAEIKRLTVRLDPYQEINKGYKISPVNQKIF